MSFRGTLNSFCGLKNHSAKLKCYFWELKSHSDELKCGILELKRHSDERGMTF